MVRYVDGTPPCSLDLSSLPLSPGVPLSRSRHTSPKQPSPVCLALLCGLTRGQDGVGDNKDRGTPWVLCLDLFAAAFRLRGAKEAVALDCLDGVQEWGAGDP